jgi:hypothetical protein
MPDIIDDTTVALFETFKQLGVAHTRGTTAAGDPTVGTGISKKPTLWTRVAAVIAGIVPGVLSGTCAAEQLDITRCYSGTVTMIDNSKGIMPALVWEDSGIIMSNSANKMLNGAVINEAGVQRGLGPERTGYGLLKIMDNDGDTIIVGGPYTGFSGTWDLLEGTGK